MNEFHETKNNPRAPEFLQLVGSVHEAVRNGESLCVKDSIYGYGFEHLGFDTTIGRLNRFSITNESEVAKITIEAYGEAAASVSEQENEINNDIPIMAHLNLRRLKDGEDYGNTRIAIFANGSVSAETEVDPDDLPEQVKPLYRVFGVDAITQANPNADIESVRSTDLNHVEMQNISVLLQQLTAQSHE